MDSVVKLLFFGVFVAILYYAIGYVVGEITLSLNLPSSMANLKFFLCSFGIFQAINLAFSILVGNWVINKIIDYVSY